MRKYENPITRFSDELDALVDRWRKKPEDDRLSYGEMVGALSFRIHTLNKEVDDGHRRLTE